MSVVLSKDDIDHTFAELVMKISSVGYICYIYFHAN